MFELAKKILAHPLTRGLDLDDPRTTELRRQLIRDKRLLCEVYEDWYRAIADSLPSGDQPVLELGSGAGFLREFVPHLITSEVFPGNEITLVLDGQRLPFADASLRAIVMTDVFHHLPRARDFLREAARCVRIGGVVSMVEPWLTSWSRVVYTHLHHEPFRPDTRTWEFDAHGPLSGANGALPWIVFQRDRARFEQEFVQWQIASIRPMMPCRYLISGGVSMRSLTPQWTAPLWRAAEWALRPLNNQLAMFAHIVLKRA